MKKLMYALAILVLLGVFGYSGYQLLDYYTASTHSQEVYNDLLSLKGQAVQQQKPEIQPSEAPTVPGETAPETPEIPDNLVAVAHPHTGQTMYMLPEFQELFLINPELVGWITIEDTKVNYPVVQAPTNRRDFYLDKNFYGKKDSRGCIYAREVCGILEPSDNITLYGHRMHDYTMFGDLGKYKNRSFWEGHPYIQFDTLWEYGTYEIMAVFQVQAGLKDSFQYHLFVDAEDAAEFDAFVARCKALSLYDTGVEAAYGDKLITLSTCDYHRDNGRLVVVAKRVG